MSGAPDQTQPDAASGEKRSVLAALSVFFERRTLVMLALGFAAGLPNLLIFDTLSAWLREAGVTLQAIGFFSLATLAYSFKFLWAPIVDRTALPLLTPMLGHRRAWMIASQAVVILGLWLVSGSNPAVNLGLVAAFAVLVAFASATQDIVIDAWRIESAGQERQGAMAAAYQWGYRVAIIVAGVAPLLLSSAFTWAFAYAVMAALMALGMLAVLAAPREAARASLPSLMPADMPKKPGLEAAEWAGRLLLLILGALIFGTGFTGEFGLLRGLMTAAAGDSSAAAFEAAWKARPLGVALQVLFAGIGGFMIVCAALPFPGAQTRPGVYFRRSYGEPLADFFTRFAGSAGLILAMICCYRLSDFVLNIMNPFYLDLGFDKERIAEVRKGFGVIMLMAGVGLGGWSIARYGLIRPLIIGAFAGPLSNLAFAWLAVQGPDWRAFATAIAVDNMTAGFSGTVLIAYMSSLTSAGFTATQYALFSSLYSLPGKLIAAQSGGVIEAAARAAAPGGPFSGLTSLFSALPPKAYAQAAEKLAVPPAAMGAGYVVFFFYSCVIGAAAIMLAFMVAKRQPKAAPALQAGTA